MPKSCRPTCGDLDLIGGDGGRVHVQPIAGEPGLDVLGALDLLLPLVAAAAMTLRPLMYRPSTALNTTNAQHITPTPTF